MIFPKTFTDKKGREWGPVHIGLAANARLRAAGISLEEFVPMPTAKMAKEPPDMSELMDLLHGTFMGIKAVTAILAPQLAECKISEEDFLEAIDDEAIIAKIGQAIYQAIIDFFQKSPLRASLVKQAWKDGAATIAAAGRAMDRVMAKVQSMTPAEMDAKIDAMIAKMPEPGKNSATSMPG